MLNVGGGELLVIALVALVALGPEQLPAVMRKLGALTSQLRSLSSDLKDEFLSGVDDRSDDPPPARRSVRFDPNEPIVPRGYAERRRLEDASVASPADEPPAAAVDRPVEPSDDGAPPAGGGADEPNDPGLAS